LFNTEEELKRGEKRKLGERRRGDEAHKWQAVGISSSGGATRDWKEQLRSLEKQKERGASGEESGKRFPTEDIRRRSMTKRPKKRGTSATAYKPIALGRSRGRGSKKKGKANLFSRIKNWFWGGQEGIQGKEGSVFTVRF